MILLYCSHFPRNTSFSQDLYKVVYTEKLIDACTNLSAKWLELTRNTFIEQGSYVKPPFGSSVRNAVFCMTGFTNPEIYEAEIETALETTYQADVERWMEASTRIFPS